MKKYVIAFSILFCMSCSNSSSNNSSSADSSATKPADEKEPAKEDPEAAKGMQLIANSDCLTCHRLTENLVGPPYAAVAAKYKGDASKVDYLVDKIIKGGSGVWGTVPMAAHPTITPQDAKSMVAYIMTVKN